MAARKQYEGWWPGSRLHLRWPETSPEGDALLAAAENSLLASALDASEGVNNCWTVRERTMIALMNELTDLPSWERKILEPDFTFKWKSAQLLTGKDVTRSMADWCVEEVKYYVQAFYGTGIVPAIDGGVVKSDVRVPGILLHAVQKAAAALRRDYSKNSESVDGMVSNVIDPYLFAFSWEKTRFIEYGRPMTLSDCLDRCGGGALLWQPPEDHCVEKARYRYPNDMAWSRRFQWSPFDVDFDGQGEGGCRHVYSRKEETYGLMDHFGSRITSYITNVHPEFHQDFYHVLETLIDATIPMFNQSLIETKAPSYQNVRLHVAVLKSDPITPVISKDVREFTPPQQRTTKQFTDAQKRYHKWLFVDLKKEFWNIGLQMVCEVREFDLSPDKSYYEGGDWHVQGQRNEYVCATATLTYSARNIKQAQLSFRRRVWTEEAALAWGYIQEPPFAPEIYGAKTGDPVIQHMGDVDLRQGRIVSFPNIWQTRLLPFELEDKSRPGHIKLLTLHLIDPNRRIISTSRVPPQRRDWWAQAVRQQSVLLWRLPKEVWAVIVDMVEGFPIGRDEAEQMRKEFVEERTESQKKHTKAMQAYLEWDLDSDAE